MTDCLFCKIADDDVPADIIYQDKQVLAFRDIDPKAPHHLLVIPRKHIASINHMESEDSELIGHMVYIAKQLATELGFNKSGFRLVFNCNDDGGQEVYHIHLHVLGGRGMTWPPG